MIKARTSNLWNAGSERPVQSFARDQLSLLAAVSQRRAIVRVWRARDEGLSLGRFHRRDENQDCDAAGLVRRLTGGRIVPQGPAVTCITMAFPEVAWLTPSGAALRPDQVLNRALRPVLAALRANAAPGAGAGAAVDAFYPGRDLITVGGRPLAHASFTVARDGALLVHVQIADRGGFDELPRLLRRFDPCGVAAADKNAFQRATSFLALTGSTLINAGWASRLAGALASELRCEVGSGEPCAGREVTLAQDSAFSALQCELGPLAAGSACAIAPSMLGAVEVSARLVGDRLYDVQFTGDVIAPFHTIDALSGALEGEPARLPALRLVVARVLSQPGDFVLGVRDLDALLARLAAG
ncbi:MAG: hypothetical protein HY899_05515 [Deltaproteobacteria bacterium]|nr:hypothetical protein [Deltaproteobacteria bacterium]